MTRRVLLTVLWLLLCCGILHAQPQRLERNIARAKANLSQALAETSWKDGELVTTQGYASPGDGGGQQFVYRASGWSGLSAANKSLTGWYIRIGATDSYLEAKDKTVANVLAFGAKGDNATDNSLIVQAMLTNLPDRTTVLFPPGVYRCGDLEIEESDDINLRGYGATLKTIPGAENIIDIDIDSDKQLQFTMAGFTFQGGDTGVNGVLFSLGGQNIHISDCTFLNFDGIAFDSLGLLNLHMQDCVFQGNDVGLQLRGNNNGTSNANVFTNCEWHANNIGVSFWNPGVYGMGNITLNKCTIQNNFLCGMVAYRQRIIQMLNTHFELNGVSGTSTTLNGEPVLQSAFHFYDVTATFIDASIDNDSILESGCYLSASGEARFLGNVVDLDSDSVLDISGAGRFVSSSNLQPLVIGNPNLAWPVNGRMGYMSYPSLVYRPDVPNLVPVASQEAPVYDNQVGVVGVGYTTDAQMGNVSFVHFSESVGTSNTNRCRFDMGYGTTAIGDRIVLTCLVKADAATKMIFRNMATSGGNYGSLTVPLPANQWRKITMAAVAADSTAPRLWVYPADDAGATVYFAKPMAQRGQTPEAHRWIDEILQSGAYSTSDTRLTGRSPLGHAQISIEDNATATTVASTQSDWSAKSQFVGFGSNFADSSNATPDHTNDHITLTSAGTWEVSCVLTCSGSVVSDLWELALWKNNGATQVSTKQGVNIRGAGLTYEKQVTISGLVDASANDTIELWVQRTNGTGTLTITNAVLTAKKVSD